MKEIGLIIYIGAGCLRTPRPWALIWLSLGLNLIFGGARVPCPVPFATQVTPFMRHVQSMMMNYLDLAHIRSSTYMNRTFPNPHVRVNNGTTRGKWAPEVGKSVTLSPFHSSGLVNGYDEF